MGVTVAVSLTEVTLDPFTNPHATGHHATEARAHTVTDETCHTTNLHHAGVSPKITVDPGHAHTSKHLSQEHQARPSSSSDQTPWKSQGQEIQASHHQ